MPAKILIVSLLFWSLHCLIFVHDYHSPEAFLKGDRADQRIDKYDYVLRGSAATTAIENLRISEPAPTPVSRAVQLGAPGDYIVHGLIMQTSGRWGLIITQVVLTWLSVIAIIYLANYLQIPSRWGMFGAIVYMLLPGTILQGHALVIEGLFNPVLVLAFLALFSASKQHWRGPTMLLAIGLLATVVFLRPHLLFLPLILTAVLLWALFKDQSPTDNKSYLGALLLPLAMAPVLLWSTYSSATSGNAQISPLNTGPSWHWRVRLERMGGYINEDLVSKTQDSENISTGEFLSLAADYPLPFIRTVVTDNANTFLNPGTTYLMRQLELFENDLGHSHFAELRDKEGIIGVIKGLIVWNPLYALFFFGAAAIWLTIVGLALTGVWAWLRGSQIPLPIRALLITNIVYVIAINQGAGLTRWSLRQPAEFAVILIALYSLYWLTRRVGIKNKLSGLIKGQAETNAHG